MTRHNLLDIVHRASPDPWTEGDNIPWDDPEFSARMLREHLSQEHALASRPTAVINQHVAWLHERVLGGRPSRVLDLGCGPGLYLHRLARRGHRGVGIDFGPASIAWAREQAAAEALDCAFHQRDLRDAEGFGEGFDLVTMIYGQINVFRRSEAQELLTKIRLALKPGGRAVLEAQQLSAIRGWGKPEATWFSAEEGLFSDSPHLALHERRWDEARRCAVERWYVIDAESGAVTRHALTTEAYTSEELEAMAEAAGLRVVERLEALPGSPVDSPLFAIVVAAP